MSESLARRAKARIVFDGADISGDIGPYLLSVSYEDSDEDKGDSLSITVHDRDGVWQSKWLCAMWEAGKSMTIQATITACNRSADGAESTLDCGTFELDSVSAQGAPATITIKGTSVPYNCSLQQTKHSKSWESYDLQRIAGEIATNAGMSLMYHAHKIPSYERVEQYRTSDIVFLKKLCKDAGLSMKVSNKNIIIFEQEKYEKNSPVRTFVRGDGTYTKYKLYTNETETYALCRVYYDNDGELIEWTQKAENYDPKNNSNQKLEIQQKVSTVEEAKALAKEMLRLYNKFAFEAEFTVPGDPALVAGATVSVSGFGTFDGNYLIKNASHSVSGSSGYITNIQAQKALTSSSSGNSAGEMTAEQVEQLAIETIRGDWGAGQERKDKQTEAGYDYQTIQNRVNEIIYG